jgi:hypothetical protein
LTFAQTRAAKAPIPKTKKPIPNERNAYYPKFCIDEFKDTEDYLNVYVRYRVAGGRMKYKESDTGNELRYTQFPGIELDEVGVWTEDRNNIAPCKWTMCNAEYVKWFISTHPTPVDVRQATRFWLDRCEMLWRKQHPAPGSYEEFLQRNLVGPGKNYEDEDGYDYISHPEDRWDKGSLYRMHIIRLQAAIDLTHGTEDGPYTMEQQIDNFLIANHEVEEGETERTLAAQQKHDATLKMVRELNAKAGIYRDASRPWPNPVPVRTPPEKHDWDFFYRSLQAPHDIRPTILAKMCSGTKPVFKSELRTQRATTLSERIGKKLHAMQAAIQKQCNVNAIIDTGSQVTTMPESAVNRMPAAHNHRDAPPGTEVKYGNGEIETIERLVDIGHYEVQITPDNCSTSLIGVDQIVADGHTVTFSATKTIITDDNNSYRLTYPRVPISREWTVPMQAMEDLSRLRQNHPLRRN